MDENLKQKTAELLLLLLEATEMDGVKSWALGVAFIYATARAPEANKTEVWEYLKQVYTKNLHQSFPSQEEPAQSYRRASGDAFEYFVLQYINSNPNLMKQGIRALRVTGNDFELLMSNLNLTNQVRVKDVDIFLQGFDKAGRGHIFGAIFPKASYAERIRADEVTSRRLIERGLWSITITLDARNELGTEQHPSVKRQTINNGGFDACFSLNTETVSGGRIHTIDVKKAGMNNPFVHDTIQAWKRFVANLTNP